MFIGFEPKLSNQISTLLIVLSIVAVLFNCTSGALLCALSVMIIQTLKMR